MLSEHPADLVVSASVVGGVLLLLLPLSSSGSLVVHAHKGRGRRGGRWPGGLPSEPGEELLEVALGRVGHHRELIPARMVDESRG